MPSLSHSQIETFRQCPAKWAHGKVWHSPTAPADALILGTAVHAAIEADGLAWLEQGQHLSLPALLARLDAALCDAWRQEDPDGLLSPLERAVMREKAMTLLRGYAERVVPHYEPVAVEQEFTRAIPGLSGWVYRGRIDAITERGGVRTVIDFKTGKAWGYGAEHGKAQATAYSWAEPEAKRVTFVVLSALETSAGWKCEVESRVTTRDAGQIGAYLETVREAALAIRGAMVQQIFPARTGPLCAWCGYLGSCGTGRAYLASTRRMAQVPVLMRRDGGTSDTLSRVP